MLYTKVPNAAKKKVQPQPHLIRKLSQNSHGISMFTLVSLLPFSPFNIDYMMILVYNPKKNLIQKLNK